MRTIIIRINEPLPRPIEITMFNHRSALILFTYALAIPVLASAKDLAPVIVIQHQQFKPNRLELPANKKVKLIIHNRDNLPAEFESYDLSREIIVPVNGTISVYVGPLKAGEYKFFNDFNRAMRGKIIVNSVKVN